MSEAPSGRSPTAGRGRGGGRGNPSRGGRGRGRSKRGGGRGGGNNGKGGDSTPSKGNDDSTTNDHNIMASTKTVDPVEEKVRLMGDQVSTRLVSVFLQIKNYIMNHHLIIIIIVLYTQNHQPGRTYCVRPVHSLWESRCSSCPSTIFGQQQPK